MAVGRRCDCGCQTWPDDKAYETCPICEQKTSKFSNLQPLGRAEALSIVRHMEFERYYAKHCAALGQPLEGPLIEC